MRRFATWCTGHRKTVIIGWIVALIGVGMISGSVGSDFSEEFKLPSSDSQEAFDLLEERFPAQSGRHGDDRLQGRLRGRVPGRQGRDGRRLRRGRESCPTSAKSPAPTPASGAAAVSEDGKIAYATVQFDVTTDKLEKDGSRGAGLDRPGRRPATACRSALGGQPIEEVRAEEEADISGFVGLLAAIVVLLLTFGSVVAMGLPVVTALFALGVGLSLVTLATHVFPTAEFAPQLAFMIGLGVGIDYALFILTRFRNGLDEGLEPRPAAIAAIDTAGRAVLFAGVTVIIALMGMMLLGLSFLYGVAMAAAVAVLFTMIAALTLLPALLTIVGRRIDRLRIPGLGRTSSNAEDTRWFRWSREIQRRPVLSAVALRRPAADPLHPDALAAPRLQRRRHRPGRHDDARGLRPARRGLRPRLQRALRDRRGAAGEGRRHGADRSCTTRSRTNPASPR